MHVAMTTRRAPPVARFWIVARCNAGRKHAGFSSDAVHLAVWEYSVSRQLIARTCRERRPATRFDGRRAARRKL